MQQTELGLGLSTKRTRKREFLAQMEQVVPWAELVDLALPYAPPRKTGRPPFEAQTMLRIHFMQQCGSPSATRRWKKRCTTYRCSASSPG
jgi:IS5 family transposase